MSFEVEFYIRKGLMLIAALIGVVSVLTLWRPQALRDVSLFQAGIVLGGIGVGGAFFLSGFAVEYFELSRSVETTSGVSYLFGLITVGLVNLVATFFKNREQNAHDIGDVIEDLKKTLGR